MPGGARFGPTSSPTTPGIEAGRLSFPTAIAAELTAIYGRLGCRRWHGLRLFYAESYVGVQYP